MTTELTAREAPASYVVDAQPAIRKGYKQTEVGVIPEDWEIKSIGHLAPLQRGFDLLTTKLEEGAYPVVYSNGVMNFHNTAMVRGPGVVTGRSGTLGKVHYVESDFWPHNTSLWVTRFNGNAPRYIYYLYSSIGFERFSSGSGVPTLNRNDAHAFLASIPPTKAEQEAIAEALSDADALIASLEQLIAKKRQIKQGTMQELLTGQKRLPGFGEEWAVKRLGDLGATYGGLTGKTKADFGEGVARYITFMNVMTNVVIDCGTFERVRISPAEMQNRAKKGDLFFNGSSETPEEVAMCAVLLEEVQDVYLNSFCFGFRFRDGAEADGVFFAYYLRGREGRELMKSLAQGSTRYNISKVALLNSLLRLPALPEQTAIATILSNMDAEIAALETQLAKARGIKQGMMQELLTGRIRLV